MSHKCEKTRETTSILNQLFCSDKSKGDNDDDDHDDDGWAER